tara:strand:- start:6934 stop:8142 length:1209 start_codon:yes stop_codon:yes gene_type:complete
MSESKRFFTKGKLFAVLVVFALVFTLSVNPFANNDSTERTVVQTVGGDLVVRYAPGWYYAGFFSTKTVWPNNFTIQVSREANMSEDADLWVVSNMKDGTFSEGDNAELEHTVKWDMPARADQMIALHIAYANYENLMSTTLLSYQKKVASFSTQRMSSEAHYSGGKSQLDEYFQDQLRNGIVILATSTKTRILEDSTSETYIDVRPKLAADSSLLRSPSDIQQFGILSTYTAMDNVHYVKEIDIKLRQKIKYAADKANSKQELIAAQQQEQTAVVQGRKLIAEVTAKEEASEQTAIIQARKSKLVAAEKLEEDKYLAASKLALKRAEAEGDKLKVAAGLSPLEQANIDMKTRIGVAEAISKRDVPMIINGGDGASGGLSSAYSMQEMIVLVDKISASKVGKK